MTPTAAELAARYVLYRARHTIAATPSDRAGRDIAGGYYICAHDGIRVFRRAMPAGWAHSEDEVRAARQAAQAPVTEGWPK